MKLNAKVKEMRESLKMTQEQLADLVFVKPNAISQYETGKRMLKTETLERIADVLGIHIQFEKTEKNIELNKDKDFFKPKALMELQTMSNQELTDYMMKTQDSYFQCLVAFGERKYFDEFQRMNFHDQWENVFGAIEQMPEDILEEYLEQISAR